MCDTQLCTQCETTQVRDKGMGAALFGYSELYGEVPGGQAELLRVPRAQFTYIKVPEGQPDSTFVYLSDVLPTAWQAVAHADIPAGGTVAVLGLGPIGDMAARIADHLGYRVIAVDLVPDHLARAAQRGIHTIDLGRLDGLLGDAIRDLTDGRGPDSVIDAVGMEAHGSPVARLTQQATGMPGDVVAKRLMRTAGIDRLGWRTPPDAGHVRQAGDGADGPGQRQALGGGHHAAAGRRRPAAGGHVRDPRAAPGPGAARLRDLPEEAGRRGEGAARAVTARPRGRPQKPCLPKHSRTPV